MRSAEYILFDDLQIEQRYEVVEGLGHSPDDRLAICRPWSGGTVLFGAARIL